MQQSKYDTPVDVMNYKRFNVALGELREHYEESDAYYEPERRWENYKKLYVMAVFLADA